MFIPFSYQMSVRMTTYDDFISSYGKLQMSSKMLMSSKLLMYFFLFQISIHRLYKVTSL